MTLEWSTQLKYIGNQRKLTEGEKRRRYDADLLDKDHFLKGLVTMRKLRE